MRPPISPVIIPALFAAITIAVPVVDTEFPYTGPAVPISDTVNPSLTFNGSGLPRLTEPPAVRPPPGVNVTNNINVISMSYIPGGMNIHFQTPFGLGTDASVHWGTDPDKLSNIAKGQTKTCVFFLQDSPLALKFAQIRPNSSLLHPSRHLMLAILPRCPDRQPIPRNYPLFPNPRRKRYHPFQHPIFSNCSRSW